ncbi:hypothetical protein [Lentzea cavernae]|uniref:hypothetical protein n=1 Tax=Lentzea cavernae TaxID=2020703 RepID=UPI00174EB476|nr:hypothetical protein [Lentzea cavernae]
MAPAISKWDRTGTTKDLPVGEWCSAKAPMSVLENHQRTPPRTPGLVVEVLDGDVRPGGESVLGRADHAEVVRAIQGPVKAGSRGR